MTDFERAKHKCNKLCLVCNEKACPIIKDMRSKKRSNRLNRWPCGHPDKGKGRETEYGRFQ